MRCPQHSTKDRQGHTCKSAFGRDAYDTSRSTSRTAEPQSSPRKAQAPRAAYSGGSLVGEALEWLEWWRTVGSREPLDSSRALHMYVYICVYICRYIYMYI